jgi:hypothetical protein
VSYFWPSDLMCLALSVVSYVKFTAEIHTHPVENGVGSVASDSQNHYNVGIIPAESRSSHEKFTVIEKKACLINFIEHNLQLFRLKDTVLNLTQRPAWLCMLMSDPNSCKVLGTKLCVSHRPLGASYF